MDRRVRDHIQDLEQRRDLLNARITEESDAEQRKQVETELRAVESTLSSTAMRLTLSAYMRVTNRLSQWTSFIVP